MAMQRWMTGVPEAKKATFGAHRLTVWAWREAAGIINGPLIRVVAKGGRRDEGPARHEQHHA
jgi:hypothetical protein